MYVAKMRDKLKHTIGNAEESCGKFAMISALRKACMSEIKFNRIQVLHMRSKTQNEIRGG